MFGLKTVAKKIIGKPHVVDNEVFEKQQVEQVIKNIQRLRLAFKGRNERQIQLLSLWLNRRGMMAPTSMEQCDDEIARLSNA